MPKFYQRDKISAILTSFQKYAILKETLNLRQSKKERRGICQQKTPSKKDYWIQM